MKLSLDVLKKMVRSIASTKPVEIGCEECFEQVDQFVELQLQGKNAAEAMPNGGNLYIRTGSVQDSHSHLGKEAAPTDVVEITIKDDGPGIPDDIRSRLFEPFTCLKAGDHRGLGLSVVHNIIKEHKGEIEFKSELENGTFVKITLPKF